MSTLVATSLQATGGTIPTETVRRGTARMWANVNEVTPTVRDSFNLSSLTDNGTGDFTTNFTNAMANTSYPTAGHNCGGTLTNLSLTTLLGGTTAGGATLKSTTQMRTGSGSTAAATMADVAEATFAVLGA